MRTRWKVLILVAVACVVWLVVAPLLASELIVEKPLEHADAIIMLSGSSAYRERTAKAAELYKRGIAPRVIITNDGERAGWDRATQRNTPYLELEQRELIAAGVLPDAITVLPGVVTGTNEEAELMADEVDARPITSLLIVTSPYHSSRAINTFDKAMKGRNIGIGIATAPYNKPPDPNWWWLSLRGWQTIGAEYVKSAYYWLFY